MSRRTNRLHPTLRQIHHIQQAIDQGVVDAAIDAHLEFFGPSAMLFLQQRATMRNKPVAQ